MVSTGGAGDHRVFVHIGTPKSGTSFIQASLRANKNSLREAGVLYPLRQRGEMFRAVLETRGNYIKWGRTEQEVRGTWAEISRRIRDHAGSSVVSNELLAAATPDQVRWFLDKLAGTEVHVVLTARHLGRQYPAAWQQGLKHGSRQTFAQYGTAVLDPSRSVPHSRGFWALQDVPAILERWGAELPSQQVHVVTCPPSAADPNLLWGRFCAVVGLDADALPAKRDRSNVSLGITEIDLLRRVNVRLRRSARTDLHSRQVNRHFVANVLHRYDSERPRTPAALIPTFQELGRSWVREIQARGYDVMGDLGELVPDDPGEQPDGRDPDAVPAAETLDLAVCTIVDLLAEVAALRQQAKKPAPPPRPETRPAGIRTRLRRRRS